MKRIIKSVLAIFLLVAMLTACDLSSILPLFQFEDFTTEPVVSEEAFYPEPIKQLLAENKPYSLEFVSNGDGTCFVSRLYLNNRYNTPFDIIIPERSPAGDVVTRIDLWKSLTNPDDVIPKYMTWERAEQIRNQVEADYPESMGGVIDKWWINAYEKFDVSKMDQGFREEMIKRYPILEYVVIGSWLPKMSNLPDTFKRLQYADITPSVTRQYYEELMQEAREAGAPEELLTPYKNLIEELPVYANYSVQVRYLRIPLSVTDINVESLAYLMLENVDDENSPARGVVLPPLGVETTLEIYDTFAKSLGLRDSSKQTFVIFSQSTSAKGYEELPNFAVYSAEKPKNNVLAWHYVDGVPTLWK